MKRIIIILWTGSVLCGACSMMHRSQKVRTASSRIDKVETRAGIRRDSSMARTDRLVQVSRHWEAVAPRSGWVYRYVENTRVAEAAASEQHTSEQQTAAVHHHEQDESANRRQRKSRVKGPGGWWLAIAAVMAVWLLYRLIRFWSSQWS